MYIVFVYPYIKSKYNITSTSNKHAYIIYIYIYMEPYYSTYFDLSFHHFKNAFSIRAATQ